MMDKAILLSMIIPVFNAEAYLSACLDSIIEARREGIELILINDGSKDGSLALCREYEERFPFVRVFEQSNSGPSAVRNRGISLAKGEYIAFADSDDYFDSAAFSRFLNCLPDYEADIWISDFHRVAENGCILDRVYQIEESEKPISDIGYMDSFLSRPDCVWNVWRCAFRKSFLERCDLRFMEGIHCAEDLEFMVRALLQAETAVFYHNPYYFYRVNYGQTLTRIYTNTRVRHLLDMLCLAMTALDKSGRSYAQKLKNKLCREYILNLAMYWELPKVQREEAAQLFKSASWLMARSEQKADRLIRAFYSVFGLRITAFVLYLLKRMKRFLRSSRMKRWEEKAEI